MIELEKLAETHLSVVRNRSLSSPDLAGDFALAHKSVDVLSELLSQRIVTGPLRPVGVDGKPQIRLRCFDANGNDSFLKIYGDNRHRELVLLASMANAGIPTPSRLACSQPDDEHSWILTTWIDETEGSQIPDTQILAEMMRRLHSTSISSDDKALLQRATERVPLHLGYVLSPLRSLDLLEDSDSSRIESLLLALDCDDPVLLHGDLTMSNLLFTDGENDPFLIIDPAGYVGPAEFDAARWLARTCHRSGATESAALALRRESDGWMTAEPFDGARLGALTSLLLLMRAGVHEVVKREKGAGTSYPSDVTTRLLSLFRKQHDANPCIT